MKFEDDPWDKNVGAIITWTYMDWNMCKNVWKWWELYGILWGMHMYMNPPVVFIYEAANSLAMTRHRSNSVILQTSSDDWRSAELGCYKFQTNHEKNIEKLWSQNCEKKQPAIAIHDSTCFESLYLDTGHCSQPRNGANKSIQ